MPHGRPAASLREVGDALDRGQAAVSHAGDTASEMAGMATQQVNTFASELYAKRNPLGTIAGAVVVGVLIGLLTRGNAIGSDKLKVEGATQELKGDAQKALGDARLGDTA